jgi:hypothetical protein
MANPIPAGTTSITPHLIVRNAPAALEMQIGNARVYLAEENPKMGAPSPQGLGGSPAQA